MANPLKILTQLSASEAAEFSKAVTFKEDVAMSNKNITGLAEGTAAGHAVRYEQLSSEQSSRISADGSLSSRLSAEESTRAADVSSETSSRVSGDASLTTRVSTEEAARSTAVSSEASARESADQSLTGRLSQEESVRGSADVSLTARVSTEESVRGSADVSLTSRVSTEESVRGSAVVSLDSRLSTDESNTQSIATSLTNLIDAESSTRSAAINSADVRFTSSDSRLSTEEFARSSADASLTSRISAEESARASAVVAANASVDSRVSAEESTRASADASLTSRVSTEESARAAAVSTEESTRASADASLTSRLSSEESVRGSAVVSLDARVGSEESTRASADASLTARVSTEESVRGSADASLTSAISAEASSRAAEDLLFLKLDGSRAMGGALNMGGFDITSAKSGSFSGDVTVAGQLKVQGSLTYLDTTNLKVKDNQIELNIPDAGAVSNSGAGIVIKGSAANKDVSLIVDADGGNLVVNTKLSASQLESAGAAVVGGTLGVTGVATFDNSLMISGSSFGAAIDGMVGYASGHYDVNLAIKAIANLSSNASQNYADARHINEINLVSGTKTYALPQTAAFAVSELAKIAIDVMVYTASGYTNDLVAVRLEADGSGYLQVIIDAPAHGNGKVRLVAVNEAYSL